MTDTVVGAIGARQQARVDARGAVQPLDAAWTLTWSIGADDRWRDPVADPTVRQQLVDAVPVVRTALRVPGGDAVQHVYGVGGADDLVVVEVANESPAPFVVALAVRGAHRVAVEGATVLVDGHAALHTARPARRWAVAAGSTTEIVQSGAASTGPFAPVADRAGRLEASFLHPVAHRATLRCVVALAGRSDGPTAEAASRTGPRAAAAAWRTHLARGLQVELPDARLVDDLTAARAATLLASARPSVAAPVVAALEDWGFDDAAAAAWRRLGWRGRRAARGRQPGRWGDVVAARPGGGAPLLLAARAFLAHETTGAVTVLPVVPPGWRGQPVDVRGAPLRAGRLSYAVRWHGRRPALLWEAPAGVRVRAPGLDPSWASGHRAGEALLTEPGA